MGIGWAALQFHLRVVVTFKRNEIVVSSVCSLQRPAVMRRDEIIAICVRKQRRHKCAARCLDGGHVVQVKVTAPLNCDAKQSNCSRDQQLGQPDASYVPAAVAA